MVTIVGVSRPRTSGSYVTKSGKRAYRGNRKHWYVYFYDDEGHFRKKQISPIQVPYYGSLIRRRKTYLCQKCGTKFRSMQDSCPKCGTRAAKVREKTPGFGKNPKAPKGDVSRMTA